MATLRHLSVKDGDVLVLVGTTKGAFFLRSNAARADWELDGPHFPGQSVDALAYDSRDGRRRVWAGTISGHWGPGLRTSDDFGRTWDPPGPSRLRFPKDAGAALKRVWQITPGPAAEPRVLYAGVEPAALFRSLDGGRTWSLVRGLWDHPHRPKWMPGGGGLGLHTILTDPTDPRRLVIAISSGGVYRTDDGGATWQVKNRGIRAEFMPDKYPEFGQCVHKIGRHPARPGRLFLQNHWGLYRSDDAGDRWRDVASGVPSDFGFALAVHPHDADVAYVVPLESDLFRCTPDGKLRVYRTRDAGRSWEPLTKGLPQEHAFETVLRDALECDTLDPAGVYFGTRSGRLYCSADGGASWALAIEGLPPILCVRPVVVRAARASGRSKTAQAARTSRAAVRRRATAKRHAATARAALKKRSAARAARRLRPR
jgi:photosystem II stability/assembly factor-like uncharacterized protein